jgi:hypothetical protein
MENSRACQPGSALRGGGAGNRGGRLPGGWGGGATGGKGGGGACGYRKREMLLGLKRKCIFYWRFSSSKRSKLSPETATRTTNFFIGQISLRNFVKTKTFEMKGQASIEFWAVILQVQGADIRRGGGGGGYESKVEKKKVA